MKLVIIVSLSVFGINSFAAIDDSEEKITQEALNHQGNDHLNLEQFVADNFGSSIKKIGEKIVSGVKKIFKVLRVKDEDAAVINNVINEAKNNKLTESEKRNAIYFTEKEANVIKSLVPDDNKRNAIKLSEEDANTLRNILFEGPTKSPIMPTREERNAFALTPEQMEKLRSALLNGEIKGL